MKKISLIGVIAGLGIMGIACYMIFGLFCLQNYDMVFWKALFMLLCLCIDAGVLIFYPVLRRSITLPFALAQISTAGIYTVLQTILFALCFTAESIKIYLLFALIFLLLFIIIFSVLYKAGKTAQKNSI